MARFCSDNVTTFRIDPTMESLAELGTEVATGDGPILVTVDSTGRFAYVGLVWRAVGLGGSVSVPRGLRQLPRRPGGDAG